MKTRVLLPLCAGILLLGVVIPYAAAAECNPVREVKIWGGLSSKPKTADSYRPAEARIGIGAFDMLDIKCPAAGYSIAEREVAIYNRLVEIISNGPVQPEAVCVGKVRSAPTVFVGSYRLVSVYPQDARAAGKSQQQLAQEWARRVAAALPQVAPTATAVKAGVVHCDRPCETQ
ncbi:MAG: hypothetical protein HPY69_08195 [Armatimonadetes bacterium]|nr:hypothetical protein [Armatimonadota bacterium]